MKKTTNTRKEEVNPLWLMGGNPGAIEAQEARGQQELVASQQLPRKCNSPRDTNATAQYHKMGIKTFTTSKGDDLFIGVSLPDGWKKEATDHSMWNNLIDDKGRRRAMFFYKAAFYDRDAFINFETRYQKTNRYPDDWEADYTVIVKDGEKVLWESAPIKRRDYAADEAAGKEAQIFLDTNFPDWKDINAYWD